VEQISADLLYVKIRILSLRQSFPFVTNNWKQAHQDSDIYTLLHKSILKWKGSTFKIIIFLQRKKGKFIWT